MANPHQERGQILIVAALFVTALLGFVGLTVDSGLMYAQRRQAQNAGDQAALAAAYELTYGGTVADATSAALENAAANGFDNNGASNSVTVNIPPTSGEHIGDASYVEAIVTENPTTFFVHVLVPGGSVQGRGVAGQLDDPGYAIFVGPTCDGTPDLDGDGELKGDNIVINGALFAADLEIEGDNAVIQSVTWLCGLDMGLGSWTFGSGPTQLAAPPAIPVDASLLSYAYYQPYCTFSVVGNMVIDDDTPQYWLNNDPETGVLKPGVYCATGEIHIKDGGSGSVSGNVTFVAGEEIELHEDIDDYNLTAFQDGVLAFSGGIEDGDDEGEIEFEADNGTWTGMLLAPYGEIELEGSNLFSPSTLIFAGEELEIEGNNIDLTAMDLRRWGEVALVE